MYLIKYGRLIKIILLLINTQVKKNYFEKLYNNQETVHIY